MNEQRAAHERLMVRAAELYYNDDLLQAQVAERLRISRWKVGRLLEEARATGVVQITISHPTSRRRDLEHELKSRFSCADAIVVSSQATSSATVELVARATASYLVEMRPVPITIAVSWGRTLATIAAALPEDAFERPRIVQLNGGAPSVDGTVDAASIIRTVASKCNRPTTRLLPVPAIVGNRELAGRLKDDPPVRYTLDLARSADVAVFSLGALTPNSVLKQSGVISEEDMVRLQERGAVGDILGHYVDKNGRIVDLDLEARTIAVPLDLVPKIEKAVAVGVGDEKADIVRAALHAGLCTTIVTDSNIAQAVLDSD